MRYKELAPRTPRRERLNSCLQLHFFSASVKKCVDALGSAQTNFPKEKEWLSARMNLEDLLPHIEALIFASERPLTQIELAEYLTDALDAPQDSEQIAACIAVIREKYDAPYYPFSLREIGGGYQLLTKTEYHKTVVQLNGDKHIRRLSSAAMETLSIIAYKQPVTKGEIEYIRGVSADYSIQKLLEKELIVITGRKEDAVGKPLIYATSKGFMDYLGINSPDSLPALRDIVGLDAVLPTAATEAVPEDAGIIEAGS